MTRRSDYYCIRTREDWIVGAFAMLVDGCSGLANRVDSSAN